MKTLYFDYSATTPVDPRVAAKMIPYLTEHFGNPASRSHPFGWEAEAAVEEARGNIAALVGADPKEIVFTSGATESNNLAIKGAGHFYSGIKGKHIITVRTEQGRARHRARDGAPGFRGLPPEAALEKVIHALESKRPRIRYYVTFPANLFAWLKRLLPDVMVDWVMLRISRGENR